MTKITSYTSTPGTPVVEGQNSGETARPVQIFFVAVANDGTGGASGVIMIEEDSPPEGVAENLSNGALTAGTDWTAAGDFTLSGGQAVYLDNTNAGTLTQAQADLDVALKGNTLYTFTYTVSGVVGTPAAEITTGIAASAVSLDLSEGTHSVSFRTKNIPGDFVISATSVALDEFTLDDLSLKQAARVLVRFTDPGTQHGFAIYKFDEPLKIERNRGLQVTIINSDHVIVTLGWA